MKGVRIKANHTSGSTRCRFGTPKGIFDTHGRACPRAAVRAAVAGFEPTQGIGFFQLCRPLQRAVVRSLLSAYHFDA